MITMIIPVLNESQTIRYVVDFAARSAQVTEVIVVDDGSIDGTPEIASAAGAKVITSTLPGKGASMSDGIQAATNEFLIFPDGDLSSLQPDLVSLMIQPLQDDTADFVKAQFSRSAGRVTVLTARPLLQTFFPELNHIEQPLGGIISGRRSLLRKLMLETD
ncbi:MAG: glycosyltransferase [Planctomycetota bacterium]